MINRMERERVVAIVSGLKPEMTQADSIKHLLDQGLNWDWGARGTNHTEMWYRFETTNIEELRITFRPKQDMSPTVWQQQHQTNSSFSSARIYRLAKGGLDEIWSTNAPNLITKSNQPFLNVPPNASGR
jgi:hypothetical protein